MWWKLAGRLAVPCATAQEWAIWFTRHQNERIVAKTDVGVLQVSTVFLGLDHSFGDGGLPVLFETMIFDDGDDSYQTRCSTWEEAMAMHVVAVVEAHARLRAADAMIGNRLDEPSGTGEP